jgi:starch synthase (maltosyl-transferring)
VRDWNASGNIKADIAALNQIRKQNPALKILSNLQFLHTDYLSVLAYRKAVPENDLIVVVNLDPHHMHETLVHLPLADMGLADDQPFEVEDLLTGTRYTWRGKTAFVRLDPAESVGHVMRVVGASAS